MNQITKLPTKMEKGFKGRIVAWLQDKQCRYELLQRVNVAVFEYNAKMRERQIQLKKENLSHLFEGEFYGFIGLWTALFRLTEQELRCKINLIRQELEDYEQAVVKMADTKRSISEMLAEQRLFYKKKISQAEQEFKRHKKF